MMRRIELARGRRLTEADLARSETLDEQTIEAARAIVDEVRERGDEAVRDFTSRFDGVELQELKVSEQEITAALAEVDEIVLDAITAAAVSIEEYQRRTVPTSWFDVREDGAMVGEKVTPIRRVGIYTPGGRAAYPSSVLMNAIPAIVAGVDEIAMVVPPSEDGTVNPYVLAAAVEAGVDEIYKVGGAQGIAALAYGTDSIERVDKITGPGNAYVTAAKKLVSGDVGIDMLAGPSEALVLADGTAVPEFVAIDLMTQAEHDPKAAVYLVTTDPTLPDRVDEALEALLEDAARAEIITASLDANGITIICPDVESALDATNLVAPEHLSVMMIEPFELLGGVRDAGAIFLGPWTPESVGDYVAGPNHTLPTGGTARFSSPLSAADFVKKSSVISYSREALEMDADIIVSMAEAEGFESHARAVTLRVGDAFDMDGEEVVFDLDALAGAVDDAMDEETAEPEEDA